MLALLSTPTLPDTEATCILALLHLMFQDAHKSLGEIPTACGAVVSGICSFTCIGLDCFLRSAESEIPALASDHALDS